MPKCTHIGVHCAIGHSNLVTIPSPPEVHPINFEVSFAITFQMIWGGGGSSHVDGRSACLLAAVQ